MTFYHFTCDHGRQNIGKHGPARPSMGRRVHRRGERRDDGSWHTNPYRRQETDE